MARRQVVFGIVLFVGMISSSFAAEPLRIGMAEADITPPVGFPMAGYYHERLATGARDPLKAKAIVFRGPTEQAAWVVCDLTGIAVDLTVAVRRRAAEKTGIPANNIILSATHSHTAPDYSKDLYEFLGGVSVAPVAGAKPIPKFANQLIAGIVDAIVNAHSAAQPVALRAGSAEQKTPVSFNRRFVMRDGSVRTWMNLKDANVVRAAGPIDPEIGLLAVHAANDGPLLGVVSNFALHLDTVGGSEWSGDYPYFIESAVRKATHPNVISLFGTGCCGDINHNDPSGAPRNKTDVIGGALGASIAPALAQLSPLVEPTLQARSAIVHVPLQEVADAEIDRAVQLLAAARKGEKVDFYDQVTAYKQVMLDQFRHRSPHVATAEHISWGLSRTWAGVGDSLPVEVHVLTLGREVAIVCLPGEVFVDLGLAIKRASPFRTTLVVELSNCVETIYIPPRAAYAAGSYEVTNSATQPGSGEMLVEAAVRLLREAASASRD